MKQTPSRAARRAAARARKMRVMAVQVARECGWKADNEGADGRIIIRR